MKQEAGPGFPPWPGTATRDVERNLAAHSECIAAYSEWHERELCRAGLICLSIGALCPAPLWFFLGLKWPTICAYVTLLRRGIGV